METKDKEVLKDILNRCDIHFLLEFIHEVDVQKLADKLKTGSYRHREEHTQAQLSLCHAVSTYTALDKHP